LHEGVGTTISLAACILFYNKLEQTIECIDSLLASGIRIYVMNNGSTSSNSQILGEYCNRFGQVKIIDSPENVGVAVGRNLLLEVAKEDWLLFLDNDIVMETDNWYDKILNHIEKEKMAEVFIPMTFNSHESRYIEPVYCELRDEKAIFKPIYKGRTNLFPGGAAFISQQLFTRLGCYDQHFFVGFEDFELAVRAIKSGNPINAKLIDDIRLIHDHRYVRAQEDQQAVRIRYNDKLILDSYNRIVSKHNVYLERNFEEWLAKQISQMTNPTVGASLFQRLYCALRNMLFEIKMKLIVNW